MQSSTETFIEKIRRYNFINGQFTLYIDKFPRLELELTNQQIIKVQNESLKKLIFNAEHVVKTQYPINAGVLGNTIYNLFGNNFVIQGSQAVIEIVIDNLFGN